MNSAATPTRGTLYLVPTPLDFGCTGDAAPAPLGEVLPELTLATAARLQHWVTENAKSTRAFLKRVQLTHPLVTPIQAQTLQELPRDIHKKGDHAVQGGQDARVRDWLKPALAGHDMGLVSEAGMPAIADPGASVVRAAHALGLRVCPLIGPISLMMALAASGLNGQQFAFVGYVPQEAAARAQRLRELEKQAGQSGQTQILIETPYRNRALLDALIHTLKPDTLLAVCTGLSLGSQQAVRSAPISDWRRHPTGLGDLALPTVFLLGR